MEYNIVAELAPAIDSLSSDQIDDLMEGIKDYHGVVGRSMLGRTQLTLTLPADSVWQAAKTITAVLGVAIGAQYPLVSLQVLPTDDFDRLAGLPPQGGLLSVTEAAEAMGVTRQRVLQQIEAHRLPATRIGNSWAVPRAALPESA